MPTDMHDNGGTRKHEGGPTETPIMVTRAGRPEHTPEAELMVVRCDQAGGYGPDDPVTLILDDGDEIVANRRELLAAIGGHAGARARRNELADRVDAVRAA